MFTKWQQVEDWIRDNSLNSWRFQLDRSGAQTDGEGNSEQKRSNRIVVLSDAFPGSLEEKIALTRRRLLTETEHVLYGMGKRGKENTGMLYCEVRLVDDVQQPAMQVASPVSIPTFNEAEFAARIRKEVELEFENQRYKEERKQFEASKKAFEAEKASAIGLLTQYLAPVATALLGKKNVAGIDAQEPVVAEPIRVAPQNEDEVVEDEVFTEEEQGKLFDLMARFKSVEPQYLQLIERVVSMAESGDKMYDMAKNMLLQ